MTTSERYKRIIEWFQINMPIAESELHYATPFELLVAVILSAQCTDKRVNMITPALFNRYPTSKEMAKATKEDVFSLVQSVNYPNNKASHLIGMAKMLEEKFLGLVPSDIELLQQLPGVGRKTANVVVSVIFNKAAMAVDTHVFRLSDRIGLTTGAKNPLQTEHQLVKHIPKELLSIAHHWLILHGRYVCTARKPKCTECGLIMWCRYYSKQKKGTV